MARMVPVFNEDSSPRFGNNWLGFDMDNGHFPALMPWVRRAKSPGTVVVTLTRISSNRHRGKPEGAAR
jgi:hypothetical protein